MNDQAQTAALDEFLGTTPRPWWVRWRWWIAAAVIVLVVLLLILRGAGSSKGPVYATGEVRRADLAVSVSATGNLAPTNQIDVGSEISGIVVKVLVDANDRVSKGQPLALIDPSRLQDQVAQSAATLAANEAAVAQAEATVGEARAQLARLREVSRLSNGRVPAATEMATQEATTARALANLKSAQANVVAARAALSSNRTQVAKAVIRSPVSGVVLKRSIDPGQTVQAAFATPSLFLIAEDLTKMKLEVSVDEADIGQVREGQQASFTVDAYPGRSFPARIWRVNLGAKNITGNSSAAATSSSNVVSYLANLTVDNRDLTLRPGMTATATIATAGERQALLVPNAALRFTPPVPAPTAPKAFAMRRPEGVTHVEQQRGIGAGSSQIVYVVGGDGNLRAVRVVTGFTDGRETSVRPLPGQSLAPGMQVATGTRAVSSG